MEGIWVGYLAEGLLPLEEEGGKKGKGKGKAREEVEW